MTTDKIKNKKSKEHRQEKQTDKYKEKRKTKANN